MEKKRKLKERRKEKRKVGESCAESCAKWKKLDSSRGNWEEQKEEKN